MRDQHDRLRELETAAHKLERGITAVLRDMEAVDPIQAPPPATEVPEGDFWCKHRSFEHPRHVTADHGYTLFSDGTWSDPYHTREFYIKQLCDGTYWHTITVDEALASLKYPIYVSSQQKDIAFRLEADGVYEGVAQRDPIWKRTYAGPDGAAPYVQDVRTGRRHILTAAEAEAIVKPMPQPTLLEAAKRVCNVIDAYTWKQDCSDVRQALKDAIAREEAKHGTP